MSFAPSGVPSGSSSDEDLLIAAARGDQSAMGQLYDRFAGQMYGLAMRITRDATLAQDVVQEAFVGIWRNAARFDAGRASARTWIMAIAHNRSIDALRRRRPAQELPDPELPPPAALTSPDIWGEVAGRMDADRVRDAVMTLSPVQREAIALAYFGGLTQQEIAERTGAPLGTVKSRVRLGLMALKEVLAGSVTLDDAPSSGGGP
ncbi:MAG: sigma-70 family RNA polymerase sigma factor [Thermoleophilia bacterium]|nr:sigma-70 family RNA polymerase sigma factor [Thermoleophilia bacterium]